MNSCAILTGIEIKICNLLNCHDDNAPWTSLERKTRNISPRIVNITYGKNAERKLSNLTPNFIKLQFLFNMIAKVKQKNIPNIQKRLENGTTL